MKKVKKIGYKGFDTKNNGELYCRDMRFAVGEIAEVKGGLAMCRNGIHFCWNINDVHEFYNIKEKVICEVEILGEILNDSDMKKSCTNKLKILRVLTKEQVLSISNSGKDNTGIINSGYGNSGDRNSGNGNSGNGNSGNRNSGDGNSGYGNSGDRNSGDGNSGNGNSGNRNSGDWNSGDRNSGYGNSGYRNSGDGNSGNRNSGYGNSGDFLYGVFCTVAPHIQMFNKDSNMTLKDFINSEYYNALTNGIFPLTEWVKYTEEEKANDKAKELIGGYLKTNTMKYAWGKWWESLSDVDKAIIKDIPNFDAELFREITGIEV